MRRLVVPLTLAAVDVGVVIASLIIAIMLRSDALPRSLSLPPFAPVRDHFTLWPALLILLTVRTTSGLYPGYGLNPTEELRRQTLSSFLLVAVFAVGGTLFRFSQDYSRLVLALTALAIFFVLPPARALTKRLLARWRHYGEPTWVLGCSQRAKALSAVIDKQREMGLRLVGSGLEPPRQADAIKHCVVVPEDVHTVPLATLLDDLSTSFQRVWIVPNLLDVASVWVTPRDLEGHLALELRNNLLEPANKVLKRSTDVLFVLLLAPATLVLGLLIGLAIRIETPGPVLYRQVRVGRNGKAFGILKFRTMHIDAESRLKRYLSEHPEAFLEWQRFRKLERDPRITRVGRVLRRLSLDELPQLWNIARGEMSLVGPRAITRSELPLYGDRAHLYTSVLPGLTGLWQVSGRSRLTYDDRVRLDTYYVRNWSIWLDLVVIARTPQAIAGSHGAY